MNLSKAILATVSFLSIFLSLELTATPIIDASKTLPKTKSEIRGLPNFAAISDVKTKKDEFFNYLLPMIRDSNRTILDQRKLVLEIKRLAEDKAILTDSIKGFVNGLSQQYRVEASPNLLKQIEELLIKVDVVPESLVLAQAANESGWGTSRFATQANNLFGVWCFSKGCGIKPLSRDDGMTHEVARYKSVSESVKAYMHNINTNPAYIHLRSIRAEIRGKTNIMNGLMLAEGLLNYSARGSAYVKEIQQLIRVNKLQEFNLPV